MGTEKTMMLEAEYKKKRDGYYSNYRKDILSLCPKHVSRVLEIGCGNGNTLKYLKDNGYCDWTGGVELFPDAAHSAATKVDQLYQINIEELNLPVTLGTIDMILCLDVLEHLINPYIVIEYLHKLLSPGGIIIASIPNVRHFSVVFPLLFQNKWEYKERGILDKTHMKFFVKSTAIELMESSGLQLVGVCSFPVPGKTSLVNAFTLRLFESFLASQYLIKVKNNIN
jgi:2-polyprenyl-3-methyl-5-hydroxy-6-metoxy-1,4-benzoquinol methylase